MKNPYTLDPALFAKSPRGLRLRIQNWLTEPFTSTNGTALQWCIAYAALGFLAGMISILVLVHKLNMHP